MAFMDGKDGSKGFVKRVASSFSMRKKKNATTGGSEPKFLPRSKSTNYESMKEKKTTGIKSSAREKIDDRGGRIGKWRSFDDNDSIWLSSDCASPTYLLEEGRLSVSFRFRVDESVVSWLSSIAKSSLPLNHQEVSIPKNTEENAENIEKKAFKEDSSTSAPNSSIVLDSSTQSLLVKKVSFSPSLGTEIESGKSSVSPTISSDLTSGLKNSEKIVESKNIRNVDEPLFWPYDQRFDWTPEDILKHFSMSPQKKKSLNAKVSSSGSPRSMRAQLLQTRKTDLKDGCKRKLVFNGPITKIPELKRTISNGSKKKNDNIKNETIKNRADPESKQPKQLLATHFYNGVSGPTLIKRNKSLPSRLRKSSKTCSKVVPIEVAEEKIAEEKAKVEAAARKKLMNRRSKTMVEDDFALINDFSIENAVGLGEFNGREGIDSEFNSDTFLFDDSL